MVGIAADPLDTAFAAREVGVDAVGHESVEPLDGAIPSGLARRSTTTMY
jgi:hypothetical protein